MLKSNKIKTGLMQFILMLLRTKLNLVSSGSKMSVEIINLLSLNRILIQVDRLKETT